MMCKIYSSFFYRYFICFYFCVFFRFRFFLEVNKLTHAQVFDAHLYQYQQYQLSENTKMANSNGTEDQN